MQAQRIETQHNTEEQVRAYIAAALELVSELEPPADLRPYVFRAAYDGFSAKSIALMQEQPVALAPLIGNGRR